MRNWQELLRQAIEALLNQAKMVEAVPEEHRRETPRRVVAAFEEYFSGVDKDPSAELRTSFVEDHYDQMVLLSGVDFVSWCQHHLCPFIGTYTFGYLPDKKIVGLSKIPRMVEVLCNRPQVQERLSQEIVQCFHNKVKPLGCGVVLDAIHTCTCTRGVKKRFNTRTTALVGVFKEPSVKAEFLLAAQPRS
jgi:GTP cyclohydrolase I